MEPGVNIRLVAGRAGESLSHERIYQTHMGRQEDGRRLVHASEAVWEKYQKRSNGKRCRGQISNRVSIDERPDVVDEQSRIGDWEIDTVIGKCHSGALVMIVERVTANVANKSAEAVTAGYDCIAHAVQRGLTRSRPTMERSLHITSN